MQTRRHCLPSRIVIVSCLVLSCISMLQMGKEKLKAVKGQTWEREPLFGRLLTFLVDEKSQLQRR